MHERRVLLAGALTALAALLSGSSVVWAAGAGGATATAAPAPAPPSGDELAARAMFDEGLRKMANGQFAEAKALFDEISTRYPASSYAESARSMSAMAASRIAGGGAAGTGDAGAAGLGGSDGTGVSGTPRDPFATTGAPESASADFVDVPGAVGGASFGEGAEAYSRLVLKRRARRAAIQLMVAGGVWGGFAGAAAIGIANPNVDGGPAALLVLLPFVGAAAGVAGTYFITSDIGDLSDGDVSAVVGGGAWGLLNGMLGGVIARRETGRVNDQGVLGLTLAGSAVGLAAGSLAAFAFRPDAGTMGLMNTGAIWGSVGALLLAGVIETSNPWPYWLIGLDAGLVLGLGLGAFLDISRARAAFLDLGAGIGVAAGFLSGAVVGSIAFDGELRPSAFAAGALGGMVLGITVTYFLTLKYDAKRKEREKLLERSLAPPEPVEATPVPPPADGEEDPAEPGAPAPGLHFDYPTAAALPTPGMMSGDPRATPAMGVVLGGRF